MSYEAELRIARELARKAGRALFRHYSGNTKSWKKPQGDLVTIADLESDEIIRRDLTKAFPGDLIISEEKTADMTSHIPESRVWIVDPMDGTKEFTQKIPEFAVSIALVENGKPVVGVVFNPVADVLVWAKQGGGTFRNTERVQISKTYQLDRAIVFASRSEVHQGLFRKHKSWFQELRPVGSIAWRLACVACGTADLSISFSPKNEWDVCAGDLLVREAGGTYRSFSGKNHLYNQIDTLVAEDTIAGPSELVNAFIQCERERASSKKETS